MPDEIQGTAILDDRDPAAEALFIVCVAGDPAKSRPFITRLPVKRGLPHVAEQGAWAYEERGATLRCEPSVLVSSTRPIPGSPENEKFEMFHNGREWAIPFLRWSASGRGADDQGCFQWCREVNEAILQGDF